MSVESKFKKTMISWLKFELSDYWLKISTSGPRLFAMWALTISLIWVSFRPDTMTVPQSLPELMFWKKEICISSYFDQRSIILRYEIRTTYDAVPIVFERPRLGKNRKGHRENATIQTHSHFRARLYLTNSCSAWYTWSGPGYSLWRITLVRPVFILDG